MKSKAILKFLLCILLILLVIVYVVHTKSTAQIENSITKYNEQLVFDKMIRLLSYMAEETAQKVSLRLTYLNQIVFMEARILEDKTSTQMNKQLYSFSKSYPFIKHWFAFDLDGNLEAIVTPKHQQIENRSYAEERYFIMASAAARAGAPSFQYFYTDDAVITNLYTSVPNKSGEWDDQYIIRSKDAVSMPFNNPEDFLDGEYCISDSNAFQSDYPISNRTDYPLMLFLAPMRDKDGKVKGLAGFTIELEYIAQLLEYANKVIEDKEISISLISKLGFEMYSPDNPHYTGRCVYKHTDVKAMLKAFEGYIRLPLDTGGEKYTAWFSVPGIGWKLAVSAEDKEFITSHYEILQKNIRQEQKNSNLIMIIIFLLGLSIVIIGIILKVDN